MVYNAFFDRCRYSTSTKPVVLRAATRCRSKSERRPAPWSLLARSICHWPIFVPLRRLSECSNFRGIAQRGQGNPRRVIGRGEMRKGKQDDGNAQHENYQALAKDRHEKGVMERLIAKPSLPPSHLSPSSGGRAFSTPYQSALLSRHRACRRA